MRKRHSYSIRAHTYRGVAGWLLSGRTQDGRGLQRVFFKTRQGATQGKAAYVAHALGLMDMSARNQAVSALLLSGM